MSEVEKGYGSSDSGSESAAVEVYERPKGFRGFHGHPITQVALLGFVCFMGPGLFNALTGLGGGGQTDQSTGAKANAALYATFAGLAFFAGSINNKLGPRLTLQLGSCGYSLYVGSFLALNIHPHANGFAIAAGAILGLCAALLWTAQGSLMMSYPTEAQKGTYVSIFWGIFNLGGVVGAAVALGTNWDAPAGNVTNSTYIGFLVLTLIGVCLPMLLLDPKNVVRTDGTKVATQRHPGWAVEIKSLYIAIKTDPMVILLFPLFFSSNFFYTWQFNDFNGSFFNKRGRALNNLVYWTSQILGSYVMGQLLDLTKYSRRFRAFLGWGILFTMAMAIQGGWGYHYQKQYTRESLPPAADLMDPLDSGYAGRIIFYIFCGLLDSMWQTTAYWLMGAMSNDPAKLAYFAGFYKSIQSAGGAIGWAVDSAEVPFMNIFAATWGVLIFGLVTALPVMHLRIKNTTTLEEETIARQDVDGHLRDTEEVLAEIKARP
ncbi:major facilitator superfamily domain-containing protein [Flagelloscypha sp. PMI_526]|nr:major facilitator superfamily domain-containing protein [Flagelloscypha sp. PMI_526]